MHVLYFFSRVFQLHIDSLLINIFLILLGVMFISILKLFNKALLLVLLTMMLNIMFEFVLKGSSIIVDSI